MSLEWWNCDQALLWIATRDAGSVREAEGHPSDRFGRDGKCADLTFRELWDDGDEPPSAADMQGAKTLLLDALRSGSVPTVDAYTGAAVPTWWLTGAFWEFSRFEDTGKLPIIGLARATLESRHGLGPLEWLAPLVDAVALRQMFPCANAHQPTSQMVETAAAKPALISGEGIDQRTVTKKTRNRSSPQSDEAKRLLKIIYPERLPSEHDRPTKALIAEVRDHPGSSRRPSADVIRRVIAARRRAET
ncbi:hypothetical protein ACRAWG_05740 [Methylobacterium sp. P31]